jgi:hypothetical protein
VMKVRERIPLLTSTDVYDTGAGCPSLVEALQYVYVEYAPLRMGGDLIFSILKNVYKPSK